jgi:hypothetical protein
VLVVQPLDEIRNRLLKIDVVLPERIVGINQQRLWRCQGHSSQYDKG